MNGSSLARAARAAYAAGLRERRKGGLGALKQEAGFILRPANATDIDAICALEDAAFVGDRLSRRAVRRFLAAPHRPILGACGCGGLIGYVVLAMPARAVSARVYSLAVKPAWRRRGVASALLRGAESYARGLGRGALRLEARPDNAPALALYRKLGYRDFGRYGDYYDDGADALRFEKVLAE